MFFRTELTQLLMLRFPAEERTIAYMVTVSENLCVNDNGFALDYYTGLTYNLNDTGAFVLKQITEGISPTQIIQTMENKYGISHKTATTDLNDFIQQLANLKLLKPSEALPDDSM